VPINSGKYFVVGSSMLSIRPSSIAIPIRADRKDLATDQEICLLYLSFPFQYSS
jgi:hypothetical protein